MTTGTRKSKRWHANVGLSKGQWQRIRRRIILRDRGRCVRCNTSHRRPVDHIIPVIRGGTNEDANLQTLCEECHRAKGADVTDYRRTPLAYPSLAIIYRAECT